MADVCKCGAEIMFLKMESGSAMPYRPDSSQMRLVRFTKKGKTYGKMVQTFESHYADCPYADEFRKAAQPEPAKESDHA